MIAAIKEKNKVDDYLGTPSVAPIMYGLVLLFGGRLASSTQMIADLIFIRFERFSLKNYSNSFTTRLLLAIMYGVVLLL